MMIIMQFTFQIILLAIGFGVGYWLILNANQQEGSIKTIGQTLGGILIVMAMILAIFSCYYSMKIANKGYMQGGCPMMQQLQEKPMMNNENAQEAETLDENETAPMLNQDENGETQEVTSEGENQPVKRNIKDHE